MDQKPHGARNYRRVLFYQWLFLQFKSRSGWEREDLGEGAEFPEGAGGSLPQLLQPGAVAVNEKGWKRSQMQTSL